VPGSRGRAHARHDERASRRLVEWADVIVCEWCLGNAVWYTANKRPGQRLLVRFHRFEIDTAFPPQVTAAAVDLWLFAGPHFLTMAAERFCWPPERCVYLPNGVDLGRYEHPKQEAAQFTLGLLGYHRRLKRLDLALDLLERLRQRDGRFRLSVKGQHPRDVWWVWADDSERTYFEEQYARIDGSKHLSGAVDFHPYDDRVPEWLAGAGFVLSLSDVESFHLAAAEGMASGAVPVLRRRHGVEDLFPEDWVFDRVDDMAAFVARVSERGWEEESRRAREHVRATYDFDTVARAWLAVVRGVPIQQIRRVSVINHG
jgi:glycosyltransferase involved in cell wall biosynthesis